MEASLLAVTPVPMPPAAPPAQTIQGNEESTPFSDLLAAANNSHDNQEEMESPSDEAAIPAANGQEVMAAELTALAFQDMPIDLSSPLIPVNPVIPDLGDLQQVKTMTTETPDIMAMQSESSGANLTPMNGEGLFSSSGKTTNP